MPRDGQRRYTAGQLAFALFVTLIAALAVYAALRAIPGSVRPSLRTTISTSPSATP
ncbi:MAG TPA: hypothetical protein VNU19_15575 [Candidatus Acidoferrum sp.]|jgi:hypothetical protein|nr:hypothetical protein [Candidatus Acidoferrum sp.]